MRLRLVSTRYAQRSGVLIESMAACFATGQHRQARGSAGWAYGLHTQNNVPSRGSPQEEGAARTNRSTDSASFRARRRRTVSPVRPRARK